MSYKIDLHTHSIASQHAFSTIEEMAKRANEKGITAFALTDHGPAAPGAPHRYYFSNIKVLPKYVENVRIFKGVEANILDIDGNLDLEPNDLKKLDIVLAGFHKLCGYEKTDFHSNTSALINLIEKGFVDVITHLGNPDYPFDYDLVLKKAKDKNVAIEVNNSSFTVSRKGSLENCKNIIKIAQKYDLMISIGSDAHISYDVGNISEAENLLEEMKYNSEYILNSSIEKIERFLESRREIKRPT